MGSKQRMIKTIKLKSNKLKSVFFHSKIKRANKINKTLFSFHFSSSFNTINYFKYLNPNQNLTKIRYYFSNNNSNQITKIKNGTNLMSLINEFKLSKCKFYSTEKIGDDSEKK